MPKICCQTHRSICSDGVSPHGRSRSLTFLVLMIAVVITPHFGAAQTGRVTYSPKSASTAPKHGITPLTISPVTGARVYWFEINTAGYGSAPISMILPTASGAQEDSSGNYYVTSGANGLWSITAWAACPAANSSQYVLAIGGSSNSGPSNTAVALVSLIPTTCGSGTNWSVDISDLSTIAAAYSLAAFAVPSTNSFSTNVAGLPALQAGIAYANTLYGGNPGTIPANASWAKTLNTIGNMLNACDSGNGASCSALFTATTPPGGVFPTNTFQAAVSIAQNTNLNLSTLFAAAIAYAGYTPILSSQPGSWILPGSPVRINNMSNYTGTTVTINGVGFGSTQGTSAIVIGGIAASVVKWSNTAITASIPAGATSDEVEVFVGDVDSNTVPFLVPEAGSAGLAFALSLYRGPPQMGIVITAAIGSHFGNERGQVTIKGLPMTLIAWSDTSITVQVPSAAVSGSVVVSSGTVSGTSPQTFTVTTTFGCST
jgi:hypothetical protein